MHALLGPSTALLMPTAPAPAPLLNMDQDKLNDYRRRLITLTCIAGIASLPQVCGLILGHLVQYRYQVVCGHGHLVAGPRV